jgi:poly(3-hydroxybutyrate) depolymerase
MRAAFPSSLLAIMALALTSHAGLAQESVRFPFNGQQRMYSAHVRAAQDPAKSRPLLVVLRDEGPQGAHDPIYEKLVARSEEMGFVLVTPEMRARTIKVDGAFVNAVVKDATERFKIDPGAVYVTALVNGGAVVQRVAAGGEDAAGRIEWAAEQLRVNDGRARRGGTLNWCLDARSRKLLSNAEWFCRP